MIKGYFGVLAALAMWAVPMSSASAQQAPTRDYMKDKFEIERVLDWGDRPVWSPDSKRIVFTRDDHTPGPAYELDLATRKVSCLTCRWGASGHVGRIYYLSDGSFLIVGPASLATAEMAIDAKPTPTSMNHLYWMPADLSLPPQPLSAQVFGEVALDHHSAPGAMRIAWGELPPKYRLMIGQVVNDGKHAFLVDRTIIYSDPPKDPKMPITFVETYDFVDGGKSISFFSLPTGQAFNGMYKIDIASGTITETPHDGQHNETHSFPNERYGLEESNRASDPKGEYRGLSAHRNNVLALLLRLAGNPDAEAIGQKFGGKTFDLYVLDTKTGQRRRLTHVSHLGGEAHQSSPAPDGRRIAFSLHGPGTGPFAGKDGLYIGTFSAQ